MKKIKRIIVCIMLLICVFTFIGCKNTNTGTNNVIQTTEKISKEDRHSEPPMSINNEYENQQRIDD